MNLTRAYLQSIEHACRARLARKRTLHMLHIRKTAGTALKLALKQAPDPPRYELFLRLHGVTIRDIPRGSKFFFVVRDPIDRFVSGFYDRLRQGAPRYNQPWSRAEADAFARFPSPDALGRALGGSGEERRGAVAAMGGIAHVQTSYWDWFVDERTFLRRRRDVLFIGIQEQLDEQVDELARLLELPALSLPTDEVAAHRTPDELDRTLSPAAREALHDWYKADFDFVALCRELAPIVSARETRQRP